MAQNDAAHGRTDTERHDGANEPETVIEGDRISKALVARHADQIGAALVNTPPEQDDQPPARFVVVTAMDRYDDTHSAILYNPDTEQFLRAGRHSSQQAWTQAEEDWSVHEVGQSVSVEEVHELERPDEEQDQPASEYGQAWVEILFDDIRYSDGEAGYQDERELDGSTLRLRDFDGRKLLATISLE